MKIAIRLDASTAIGTGHVKRMLAVAHALRARGAEILFVQRPLDLHISAPIASEGYALAALPPPASEFTPDPAIPHSHWAQVSQRRDAEQTREILLAETVDAVIVDHYAFDATWHRAVGEVLGVPVMVIDDLADRPLWGEWLVDHNFHPDHAAKYRGLLPAEMMMLAGPSFAMLGPSYAAAPRYRTAKRVESIGVFMGGVDLRGDSLRVLEALDAIDWKGPVEVVSTSANPAFELLERAAADRGNVSLTKDLPDLAGFFSRHDLQIGAGGGATWERCCIGPPTICLICAQNQRLSVPFLDAAGVVIGHDMLDDAPPGQRTLAQAIGSAISDFDKRTKMHKAATALVDGSGAERIADALMKRR